MISNLYQHIDGGLYEYDRYARSADTGKTVVIYDHLWPFEQGCWVRDKEEFDARFTKISQDQFNQIVASKTREQAQADITEHKALRRAKQKMGC